MWRWFKWVLLAITLFFISVGAYYWWVQIYSIKFSEQELKLAEDALSAGITLTDPKDDFFITESNDEKMNPEKASPYRRPEFDVKSFQVGADQEFFYYKVTYYAPTSNKPPKINGDTIISSGVNFDLIEPSGRILAVLHTSTGWSPFTGIHLNGTYYSTGPTGVIWPENARFSKEKNTDSKMAGGIGTDYQLGRFPLKGLGLKYGETMYFDVEMEGGSSKYSHAFADAFLGTEKTPAIITWTVGTKNYSVNNNPEPYNAEQNNDDKTQDDKSTKTNTSEIVDFETCSKVYPVLETYPEQCKTDDGKTFTKKY